MKCHKCKASMVRVGFDPYSCVSVYECPMCGERYATDKMVIKTTKFKKKERVNNG